MHVQLFQLNIRLSNGVFSLLGLCKSLFDSWLSLIPIKVPKYHFYYDCFETIENKIAKIQYFDKIAHVNLFCLLA